VTQDDEIAVGQVLDELDEVGKAKFGEALAKARLKKVTEQLAQLRAENTQLRAEIAQLKEGRGGD